MNVDVTGKLDRESWFEEVRDRLRGDHPAMYALVCAESCDAAILDTLDFWMRHSKAPVVVMSQEVTRIDETAQMMRKYIAVPPVSGKGVWPRVRYMDLSGADLDRLIEYHGGIVRTHAGLMNNFRAIRKLMVQLNLPDTATVRDVLGRAS